MFSIRRSLTAAAVVAVVSTFSQVAQAANVVTKVQNFGPLSLPFSTFYGTTFTPQSAPAAGDTFYEDYAFTVSNGTFSSVSATFDLGSILQISNLQARLFAGLPWAGATPGVLNPADLLQRWSNVVSAGAGTGSYQAITPYALGAGNYVLEIRGNVTGAAGGSYAGVFNVAAVPEPDALAMVLAGAGVIGFGVRRRKAGAEGRIEPALD